ncbi:MAG: DUF4388 domain-containing protein [Planctomycetota bacterium]
MNFAGDLANIGLAAVFEEIHLDRLTGTLSIEEHGGSRAHLQFVDGRIRLLSLGSDHAFDYGGILAEAGVVSESALAAAARKTRRRTWKGALRGVEDFDEESFDAAVAARLSEEIVDLLAWKQGAFSFTEGDPDETLFDREQRECRILVHPKELVLEAARRRDAWARLRQCIPSPREILMPAAPGQRQDKKPPEVERVLAHFDGTTDLAAVLSQMGDERYHVLNTVADLVEEGLLVPAAVEHLRHLAAEAKKRGDIHVAIRHLESALGRKSPPDSEVRRELLQLYERSGRREEAARQYRHVAQEHAHRGDLDGTLNAYVRAAELVPHDPEPQRRIMEVYATRAQLRPMRKVGTRLVDLLASQRKLEDAVATGRFLLEHLGEDTELSLTIAKLYGRMHEPERAVAELLPLADKSYAAGRYEEALRLYRNALAMDHENEHAAARIRKIESGALRLRRTARRRRIVAAVLALVAGLGAWQGAREWFAHEALQIGVYAALSELGAGSGSAAPCSAAAHYAQVCGDFPLTHGATQAEEILQQMLLQELARLRGLAVTDPRVALHSIRRLERIPWPHEIHRIWLDGRSEILSLIRTTVASGRKSARRSRSPGS